MAAGVVREASDEGEARSDATKAWRRDKDKKDKETSVTNSDGAESSLLSSKTNRNEEQYTN